jgi:hypothetical protein
MQTHRNSAHESPSEQQESEQKIKSQQTGVTHLARTMMLSELTMLLDVIDDPKAEGLSYHKAVVDDNCLGKPTVKSRTLSYKHLQSLYGLETSVSAFRALRYFWQRDENSKALLALLCAYSRDIILRENASFILDLPAGTIISREHTEYEISLKYGDRFSAAMLRSTAQNINGTWTQSGHLLGKVKKTRNLVEPTPGAVAYALFLGNQDDLRGMNLLTSQYTHLLDNGKERIIDLAEIASAKGWMIWRRLQDVVEVDFPKLKSQEDLFL